MTDYAPIKSTTSGNTRQDCVAIMDIPKFGRDESIFTKWQVYAGARSYYDIEDTNPRKIIETRFRINLEEPDYEN
jgi:hypothetical protein